MTRVNTPAALLALAFALAAPSPAFAQPPRQDHPRVRFGISGVGGGFAGSSHGGVGGLAVRVGLQVDDHIAIFIQGQGLIGQFLPSPGDNLTGFAFHALMLEFTLADLLQLGVGPSLDYVWGCSADYQRECTGAGPYFGGDMRLAFIVGSHGPGRRSGLAFSFDVHPTFFGSAAMVVVLFGIGAEFF